MYYYFSVFNIIQIINTYLHYKQVEFMKVDRLLHYLIIKHDLPNYKIVYDHQKFFFKNHEITNKNVNSFLKKIWFHSLL